MYTVCIIVGYNIIILKIDVTIISSRKLCGLTASKPHNDSHNIIIIIIAIMFNVIDTRITMYGDFLML